MRGRHVQLAALAATALIGVGCTQAPEGAAQAVNVRCPEGSDCYDPPMAIGDGGDVAFTAVDFAFPDQMGTVSQGDIEVTLDNLANGEHNIVFVGANTGSDEKIVAGGNSEATGTVNLFAGDYEFFCDIPGHRASGMESTLTVYATEELAAEAAELEGLDTGGAATDTDDVTDENDGEVEEAGEDSSSGSLENPDSDSDPRPEDEDGITAAEDAAGGAGGGGSINVADQYDTEADAAETLDADDLTEDSIAELDDSDDIAAALDENGFARAYRLTFASGSATLSDEGDDVLDQIEALLADDEDLQLRIEGNTDSDGDAETNATLSEDRAAAVVAALIDRGVTPQQLSAVGNGEENLLVEEETNDLAKQVNRRVEIYVVN